MKRPGARAAAASGGGRTGALLVALPRLAAHAPFPGGDAPAVVRQIEALEALRPFRKAVLAGTRGWETRALLPSGWQALREPEAAVAWAEGLDEIHVAGVIHPGVERWAALDARRLSRLGPRRWRPPPDPSGTWVRSEALGGGVTCLREALALLVPACDTDWVNAYHLRGGDRAILVDAGCGVVDYAPLVDPPPETVVLTHGDWDHAGGRRFLTRVHCHAGDVPLLRRRSPVALLRQGLARLGRPEAEGFALPRGTDGVLPLADGMRFALGGGVVLEVVHVPGHTAGEVALWDAAGGRLFSGDAAYVGPLYAADPVAFAASAARLASLPGVRAVYGGHGPVPASPALLPELAAAAAAVRDGRAGPGNERGGFVEHAFDRFSIVVPRNRRP